MKKKKIIPGVLIISAIIIFVSIFADRVFFWNYQEDIVRITLQEFFSADHLYRLIPLAIIIAVSAIGIIVCIKIRKNMMKKDPRYSHFAEERTSQNGGNRLPDQEKSKFMTLRWWIMIVFSVIEIFGGVLLGVQAANIYFPVLSCGANTQQTLETSCYMLANPEVLLEQPVMTIVIFFVSTILFTFIMGRIICGFLCPMGLIQDIMDHIRTKRSIEGVRATERTYAYIKPIKWLMVFLFLGLALAGGSFCNICPAITVSPVLGGMQVSIFVSGFMMIFVVIGSFFKRRFWCNICPLGFLIGFAHKISPFRIKKDVTACTECGACYEACPMGIKVIYTERDKADVTDQNCIMCGECVKKCPENNALSVTFLGHQIYKASRHAVTKGYSYPACSDIRELAGLQRAAIAKTSRNTVEEIDNDKTR